MADENLNAGAGDAGAATGDTGNAASAGAGGAAADAAAPKRDTLLTGSDAPAKEAGDPGTEGKEPAPGANAVPEKYDFKLPDGSQWGEGHLAEFGAQAKSIGLTQEQAQKVLDLAHANQTSGIEEHWRQVAKWGDEIKMDKEMGGKEFDATVMQAKAGLKEFDNDGKLYAVLEESGYGSHPEVVRFLSKVGKALGEDKLVTGRDGGKDAALEDRLFKNMKV